MIASTSSHLHDFDKYPCMGCSIGVRGEVGGGTLGGYLLMQSPTKLHKGFLTNSHVVAPAEGKVPGLAITEYNTYGLPYSAKDEDHRKAYVHYFAGNDVAATMEMAQGLRVVYQEQINDRQADIEARRELGNLTNERQQSIQSSTTRLWRLVPSPTLLGLRLAMMG